MAADHRKALRRFDEIERVLPPWFLETTGGNMKTETVLVLRSTLSSETVTDSAP